MRRLEAIAEGSTPRESAGMRASLARDHGFRAGEPIFVCSFHNDEKRVWLAGWHPVDDDEIGPDGCLLHAEVIVWLSDAEGGVYVVLRSGKPPQPDFFTFCWTYEEPDPERLPEDLLVLVDTSSSMEGIPLRNARRALFRFVDCKRDLGLDDRLGLVTFGGEGDDGVDVVCLPGNDADGTYDAFARAVSQTRAKGRTPMAAALRKATEVLETLPEEPGVRRRRRLLLITDGYPCPGDAEEIEALADELARQKVYIATVGVGEYFDRQLLTTLAARTRAPFVEVHEIRQLPYLLEALA